MCESVEVDESSILEEVLGVDVSIAEDDADADGVWVREVLCEGDVAGDSV